MMGLVVVAVIVVVMCRGKSLPNRVKDLEEDVAFLASEIDRLTDEMNKLRNMQIDNARLHTTPLIHEKETHLPKIPVL